MREAAFVALAQVDAGVEDAQHFVQDGSGHLLDAPGSPRPEVDRLDLLHHHESGDRALLGQGDVEGDISLCIGDRTDDSHAGLLIEEIVADDQSWPPAPFFS